MVQPILASTLYQLAKSQTPLQASAKVSSGFESINEALQGGLQRGRVTAISGERGTGKTLIAFHTLVSHLLSNPKSQVAIIDSTGAFDVARLYKIILNRIKAKKYVARAVATSAANPKLFHDGLTGEEDEAAAASALGRVKIMRVFDFIGVSEAISELRDGYRKTVKERESSRMQQVDAKKQARVADSQAEEGDEDIMLFDGADDADDIESQSLDPDGVVVVDNITSVVNPILKSSYVQGQVMLTTFMRTLSTFCEEANIACILLNSAASPPHSQAVFPGLTQLNRSADLPPSTYIEHVRESHRSKIADHYSIFASTTVQPSLGKSFAALVDCHLLLSMLPKRRKDAEVLVGGKSGKADAVHVIEVLSDRGGNRYGKWAAFEISSDGTQIKAP